MDDKIKMKFIHEDDDKITEKKMRVVEEIMDLCDLYKEKNKMDDKIKDVHIWVEFLNEDNKITEKRVDVLEEFGGFDKKPEISYTITGQQPFKNKAGEYWTEEVKVYTFDEAIEKAKIFSKKYHDVYISKQFEYVYQMK